MESSAGAWEAARQFIDTHEGKFIFCTLAYELKDDLERLASRNPAFIPFPALYLFVPQMVYTWEMDELSLLQCNEELEDRAHLEKELKELHGMRGGATVRGEFASMEREQYLEQIKSLQAHIQRGDIYEVNFCQEFRANEVTLQPWNAFNTLNEKTKAPYSCHIRIEDLHLLCGSPELFLEKTGCTVRSRPIKGTRKRGKDAEEDERLRKELQDDLKERAENVMITDLVRNDLSHTAMSNTVEVEELCEVYSYDTVHQMISTVRSKVSPETHVIEIIQNCFPMGSMTGAPKIRAMELIEEHESFKRGIYSGAVGLITPARNFTFNVVIRSILYDAANKKASVAAGGAITALSIPENEYEESLLKAQAMLKVLGVDL
jgi:para-aminobenzoate synthetase component 1